MSISLEGFLLIISVFAWNYAITISWNRNRVILFFVRLFTFVVVGLIIAFLQADKVTPNMQSLVGLVAIIGISWSIYELKKWR